MSNAAFPLVGTQLASTTGEPRQHTAPLYYTVEPDSALIQSIPIVTVSRRSLLWEPDSAGEHSGVLEMHADSQ